MKKIKFLLTALSLLCILYSCNFWSRKEQFFTYTPLGQYQYTEADIQAGTELQLLAFSGGVESDEDNQYYYQFIVYDKAKGDTLRVLCPLISIAESVNGLDNKTYTSPLQYDLKKRVMQAFYEPMDSTHNLLLQTEKVVEMTEGNAPADFESLMKKVDKKRFVVSCKDYPELDNPAYRTAIGILNFKEMSW